MLKVTVEGSHSLKEGQHDPENVFELDQKQDQWLINKELFNGDIVRIRENHYHVIWKNQSYNVELINFNHPEKTYQLLINGRLFTTTVKDQFDVLLEGMGMQSKPIQKINNIKAPMPGLIQSIAVTEGDQVNKGDTLLVLVAMKMENVIKSSGEGTVKSLKVSAGEIVEKNQVMLEFE